MDSRQKKRLFSGISIGAILGIFAWLYLAQFNSAWHSVLLNQSIGESLAEQSAKALGATGRIVSISINRKDLPELKTQLQAFRANLKQLGQYELREAEIDPKDQASYRAGNGFSGGPYVEIVKRNANADLFVSFLGVPKLTSEQIVELGHKPKLLVEASSADNLADLFEKKLIIGAIVPRSWPGKPISADEWFEKRYQIVTAENIQWLQIRN